MKRAAARLGGLRTIVACAAVLAVITLALAAASCTRGAPAGGPSARAGPARVVVLSPALAVTMRDLGLDDLVVGRHGYDMVLPKSVPVCGDQAGIDYEALLATKPTHVLVEWGSRPLPERLRDLAAEHSWKVTTSTLLTLDQIESSGAAVIRELAPEGDRAASEAALARLRQSWTKRGEYAGAGRVLLVMGTTPVCSVLGPGSCHQEILERIGGVPAIRDGSPYMELDAEDVARLAPGAIVILSPRAPDAAPAEKSWPELERRLGPLARLNIPAVRDRRVALIDYPLVLLPSTSLSVYAEELATKLQWWREAPPGGE